MTYTAEISRANPSCLIFLVDQSGSMGDPFGAGDAGQAKAQGVATALNRLLKELVIKCSKSEGVRDYFHIGVIGYGAQVGPAFMGTLAGRDLVPISEIADVPARLEERSQKVEDGAGGLVDQSIKFPVWLDPVANGATPMCEALSRAQSTLQLWLNEHPACFPPMVINITDGEATDGDPTGTADSLKSLTSNDGQVLLLNVHCSSQRAAPIEFPDSEEQLPDDFARRLFRMSSTLPEHLQSIAQQEGYKISSSTRGFAFNADMVAVIKFLDIGTRPANLR